MVEQELMKFDEDNNKFHPCFPVSKLRVCLTWQDQRTRVSLTDLPCVCTAEQ